MSALAVTKRAEKPFWMARQPIATALERGLEEEVEVLDGLDERKLRLARESRDTRVVAVRHFLRHE